MINVTKFIMDNISNGIYKIMGLVPYNNWILNSYGISSKSGHQQLILWECEAWSERKSRRMIHDETEKAKGRQIVRGRNVENNRRGRV